MNNRKPCMLMILDGWGINPETRGNAVALARTPNLDRLMAEYSHTSLLCSGEAVGLPAGIMGNSEVGHLNLGAGRIVYQELLRIDLAIQDRSFFQNPELLKTIHKVRESRSALHLMGLVSDGGVHSQLTHLFALLDMAAEAGLTRVFVHAILDGRDTPPDSGVEYVRRLQERVVKTGAVIATVCGRFYAMDRDTRWDRTREAYELYTLGRGIPETDPVQAVRNAYQRGETDEFVKPVFLTGPSGKPFATIGDGDGVIVFNFRADRVRQITRAFTEAAFDAFPRAAAPSLSAFTCMTLYDEHFPLPIAFPPQAKHDILGEIVSRKGMTQLRIAETEKYAHVTYFFNGGEEKPFDGEDRCLIPSPREVATYDLKPEMSAPAVAAEAIKRIQSGLYDLFVLNFANMDMVGHTGIMDAAIRAVETVDTQMGMVCGEIQRAGGIVLVTADHGNAEMMIDAAGNPHTAHTLNPVRLILVDDRRKGVRLKQGRLGDVAPTILDLMGIEKPAAMTGMSLIE